MVYLSWKVWKRENLTKSISNVGKRKYTKYIFKNITGYFTVDKENIYLLHACRKQKNKTEKRDKDLVRKRASELGKQLGKKFI